MFQNSKTRYLHISVNEFVQKSWSFRFEMFFGLGVKVEAPMLLGRCRPLWAALYPVFTGSERGSFSLGKHIFPGAHASEMKRMS